MHQYCPQLAYYAGKSHWICSRIYYYALDLCTKTLLLWAKTLVTCAKYLVKCVNTCGLTNISRDFTNIKGNRSQICVSVASFQYSCKLFCKLQQYFYVFQPIFSILVWKCVNTCTNSIKSVYFGPKQCIYAGQRALLGLRPACLCEICPVYRASFFFLVKKETKKRAFGLHFLLLK